MFTLKMWHRFCNMLWKVSSCEFTSGIGFVVTLSCVLSIGASYLNISAHALSLDSSVVFNGHVYKLLTYGFYHEDVGHLFLSAALLVMFCSGLEKGVGTVRFLHHLLFLLNFIGLVHVLLEMLLFSPSARSNVSGLIPASLSMLGTVTMSSRMRKSYLLGFTVPTAVLPWLLMLIVYLFIPNTVFLCDVVAVITGQMYGMKWFSVLQMSESKACVFEKMMPFRLLKKITCVHFVPASAGERKKILHTTCSPSPGSYPVQAYAPVSMIASQAAGNASSSVDGWSNCTIIQQDYTDPSLNPGYSTGPRFGSCHGHTHGHSDTHGHTHGHSDTHGHTHGHSDTHGHTHGHSDTHGHTHGHRDQYQTSNFWMPKPLYAHSNFIPPENIALQSFCNSSHTTPVDGADSVLSFPVLSSKQCLDKENSTLKI